MALKPEFELLDKYFKRLYANIDVDHEFLCKVMEHIKLCEFVVETDKEKSIIVRANYLLVE